MRKFLLFILLLSIFYNLRSQEAAAVDSMKNALAKATTAADKVYWLDILSRTLMNVNPTEAEEFGKKLIYLAEESRDRKLMIYAYVSNGVRCSYFAGQKDYIQRSIDYYSKGLEMARQNRMDEETGGIQLRLASIYLAVPDKDKALSYVNQGFSVISALNNDSLKIAAYNTFGNVYQAKNEKTLALRQYLNALHLAEDIQKGYSKPEILRTCYVNLSSFYSNIEDYDKAIDYMTQAYKALDNIKQKNAPYQKVTDLNNIGNLFAYKKNYDIAISYFERSIAMADSLKFETLKIPGYISLLNQYLRMDEPIKALEYMNSPSGINLKKFLSSFGFNGTIDQAYAVIYTEMGKYDSARKYFTSATPYFENNINESNRMVFYSQLAMFYKLTGENQRAIDYLLKVKEVSEKNGALETIQNAAKNLDTLYARLSNYQLANQYNGIYYKYKDSIEKLNREKELAQVEASDEQYRLERMAGELAEKKEGKIIFSMWVSLLAS